MTLGRRWCLAAIATTLPALLGPLSSRASAQVMDDHLYTYLSFDELEYAGGLADRPVEYDAQAWIGGDFTRLWLKTRGEQSTLEGAGAVEAEALYSRTISAFWNLQGGVRLDRRYGAGDGATRGLLAVGVEGLAPYWFEVESFLYLSHDGDLSARLEVSYDLLLTQRLIVEPEAEVGLAVQDVPEHGVASGLDAVELGIRVRYEVVRELAPYVGLVWARQRFSEPPPATRTDGSFVAGLRWWY